LTHNIGGNNHIKRLKLNMKVHRLASLSIF